MNRVDILCDKDHEIMMDFSRRCMKRLDHFLPLRLFLSLFKNFVDANVLKETRKNRVVIGHAANAFDGGKDLGDIDLDKLFEMTKEIDHDFARRVANPFFSLDIRHDDFADIRKRRMTACSRMVYDLLSNWDGTLSFSDAVRRTYSEDCYREVIHEMLCLYTVETRMLGSSITLHGAAGRAKDLFSEKLCSSMEKTAGEIASGYARSIYADEGCSTGNFGGGMP